MVVVAEEVLYPGLGRGQQPLSVFFFAEDFIVRRLKKVFGGGGGRAIWEDIVEMLHWRSDGRNGVGLEGASSSTCLRGCGF